MFLNQMVRAAHMHSFDLYIYNEENQKWNLSPAYDLTYSRSEFGGHTTTVNGNAEDPSDEDILKVGCEAGMSEEECLDIMEEVKAGVERNLGEFLENQKNVE